MVLPRLVLSLFNGPPPDRGYFISHADDDKNNCRADNLRWVSRSGIMQAAYWRGLENHATPSTFDVRLFNECMGNLTAGLS